jgi:LPS export ABC transporter protein LptC
MNVNVDRGIIIALGVFLVLSAALYGAYALLRGTELAVPTLFQPASGTRLLMSMEGFRFVETENGRVSWRMVAGSADLYENKEARLQEIEILYTNPDNNKEAALRGETGTMDTTSGNVAIRRGEREVRIVTSDGYLLTTDSLFWKASERIVWTADAFKLLGSEIYLEGVGLSADVDMRTIVVKDNVKAVLQE